MPAQGLLPISWVCYAEGVGKFQPRVASTLGYRTKSEETLKGFVVGQTPSGFKRIVGNSPRVVASLLTVKTWVTKGYQDMGNTFLITLSWRREQHGGAALRLQVDLTDSEMAKRYRQLVVKFIHSNPLLSQRFTDKKPITILVQPTLVI